MNPTRISPLLALSGFFPRAPLTQSLPWQGVRHVCTSTENISLDASSIKMPVVDAVVQDALQRFDDPFKGTRIIYIQHSFPTSIYVMDSLLRLGATPRNIFVMGKSYSECPGVAKEIKKRGIYYQDCPSQALLGGFKTSFARGLGGLFTKCLEDLKDVERFIIVDHGGHGIEFMPPEIFQNFPVVGIEKTTGGLFSPSVQGIPFPIIDMARCAAKKFLESPIIAEEIVDKVSPFIPIKERKIICGIVGYGAIGKALTEKLLAMGHQVMVYDHDPAKLNNLGKAIAMPNLSVLLANSTYILGCTGHDITASTDLFRVTNGDKTIISCSSGDEEVISLLQLMQKIYNGKVSKNPLGDITHTNEMGSKVKILQGGFPINFDRQSEASKPEDIQITRALSVGSVLHAAELFQKKHIMDAGGGIYKLSSRTQKIIAKEFQKSQPIRYSSALFEKFDNEDWIKENSGGQNEPANSPDDQQKPQESPRCSL